MTLKNLKNIEICVLGAKDANINIWGKPKDILYLSKVCNKFFQFFSGKSFNFKKEKSPTCLYIFSNALQMVLSKILYQLLWQGVVLY